MQKKGGVKMLLCAFSFPISLHPLPYFNYQNVLKHPSCFGGLSSSTLCCLHLLPMDSMNSKQRQISGETLTSQNGWGVALAIPFQEPGSRRQIRNSCCRGKPTAAQWAATHSWHQKLQATACALFSMTCLRSTSIILTENQNWNPY